MSQNALGRFQTSFFSKWGLAIKNVPKSLLLHFFHSKSIEMDEKQYNDPNLIKERRIPWACPTFYVNKHEEQIRGQLRMIFNYTKLNEALMPLRYPIPDKYSPLHKIQNYNIFNKFDLKK